MTNKTKAPREPWEDGCVFNPHGVACRDPDPNCTRCGWMPEEVKRRAEAIRTARENTERSEVNP